MTTDRILVLSTGGTIASVEGADGRSKAGALSGESLVAELNLGGTVELEVESVFQKPSNALELGDLLRLRSLCAEAQTSGRYSGVVVTHGTDTLEDTAFFLQSSLSFSDCPVCITGSQRPPHAAGTDAYVNLASAIRVAASSMARGCGVLVVFNETIFSANQIRKVSSFRLDGFDAPYYGPIGYTDGAEITIVSRPILPRVIVPGEELPRVDILTSCLGASERMLVATVESGAKGIVIEGVGRGQVPPAWVQELSVLRGDDFPIVIVTSCMHGPLREAYDYPGCFQELKELGVIPVSNISARKARLRLMLALSSPEPKNALRLVDPFE